jgi:hypothetical protein
LEREEEKNLTLIGSHMAVIEQTWKRSIPRLGTLVKEKVGKEKREDKDIDHVNMTARHMLLSPLAVSSCRYADT